MPYHETVAHVRMRPHHSRPPARHEPAQPFLRQHRLQNKVALSWPKPCRAQISNMDAQPKSRWAESRNSGQLCVVRVTFRVETQPVYFCRPTGRPTCSPQRALSSTHSTLPLAVVGCHSLGIYTLILLALAVTCFQNGSVARGDRPGCGGAS
jgi:hypothetical protein